MVVVVVCKYIRFGLRIETGAERTTIIIIIVDIFDDIIQPEVRDTGIHLKVLVLVLVLVLLVDEEPKSSRVPQKINNERQKRQRTHARIPACHKATTRLLHNNTN